MNPGKRLRASPEVRKRKILAKVLPRNKRTDAELARRLGLERGTVRRARISMGLSAARFRTINPGVRAQIKRLYKKGLSKNEIGAELIISQQPINEVLGTKKRERPNKALGLESQVRAAREEYMGNPPKRIVELFIEKTVKLKQLKKMIGKKVIRERLSPARERALEKISELVVQLEALHSLLPKQVRKKVDSLEVEKWSNSVPLLSRAMGEK